MAFFPRSFVNQEAASLGPFFRLLEDFDSHSRQAFGARTQKLISPRFDVQEFPEQYELHGEFPGFEQKNISLEFTDPQTLTVRARQEHEQATSPAQDVEAPKAIDAAPQSDTASTRSHQPTVADDNEDGVVVESPAPGTPKTEVTQLDAEQTPAPAAPAARPRGQYHVHERSVGEFYRQFSFPGRIDQDAVSASMKNGILTVVVPKAKKHETRKINIQ